MATLKAGEDAETLDRSYIDGVNVISTGTLENSLEFLKKLNVQLPYDAAISLPGIYPREIKIYVHAKNP